MKCPSRIFDCTAEEISESKAPEAAARHFSCALLEVFRDSALSWVPVIRVTLANELEKPEGNVSYFSVNSL